MAFRQLAIKRIEGIVAVDKEMAARIESIVADEEEKGTFPIPFHIKR
jgi:hypothetical protein